MLVNNSKIGEKTERVRSVITIHNFKKFYGIITFMLIIVIPAALYGITTFERTYGGIYGDDGRYVQQTLDGGYIITGEANYAFGQSYGDVYLIKTNSYGDTIWTRTYRGDCDSDNYNAKCVQQTLDTGYILVGGSNGIHSGYVDGDIYLIKTDSMGDTVWTKAYSGSDSLGLDWGNSVQQTSDEGYFVVGYTSFNEGDVYLIKTDSYGDTLWTRNYGGEYSLEEAYSGQQTSDGGYIAVGYTIGGGVNYGDVYLIKTDSSGDTLWTRTYYHSSNACNYCYSVQQTSEGGYIITGQTSSGYGHSDVYLIKTDSSGDTIWTRTYGGWDDWDSGNSVQQTSDGGYIITGETGEISSQTDVYLIRTDSSGDTIWTRTYGGIDYDYGSFGQQTLDGGYIVVGQTGVNYGLVFGDVYLIKTDRCGNVGNIGIEEEGKPDTLYLIGNYPNPVTSHTVIQYFIPRNMDVELTIYNIKGQRVRTLIIGKELAGTHTISWNGKDDYGVTVANGIYFYKLKANNKLKAKKMLLLR